MPLLRDIKDQLGSSYLIDHADNPVDWWAWGDDALAEAARRDRPIFLSVGYAACHWCHVMAHESFEDVAVAGLLNDSFISIKVDREERPDVDALYMAATQLVSGSGGWPMSVFLLPDGRPFMAGTYYPPVDRHGQVSFTRLLHAMDDAWRTQRDAVVQQALNLRASLDREISYVDHLTPIVATWSLDSSRQSLRDELVARGDDHGGFGGAPKFPRPSYVNALLAFNEPDATRLATDTLQEMSHQGLYDHVRGGFARYSVDAEWHVPHFEKMLSDQALLARAYLRASRVMDRPNEWREVAIDTLNFVLTDLNVHAGFASSLDADAKDVEGSHVTWTPREVAEALHAKGLDHLLPRVLHRWSITSPGHFEGRSIPRLARDEPFTTPLDLRPALAALREARARRPQPARDEKVILEWNAMLASALISSGDDAFVDHGLRLLHELSNSHWHDGAWWRTERHNAYATASDVAWFIDAHVDAFEATGDDPWLIQAQRLATYLLEHFWDGDVPTSNAPDRGRGLFFQSDLVTDLPARPKEIFDGATPSSHAVGCRALARLALCRGDQDLLAVAARLVELAAPLITSHPGAVPDLIEAAGYVLEGIEVVIPGDQNELSHHVRLLAMTSAVVITGRGASPLLADRLEGLAYVCRAGVCRLPVATVRELDGLLPRVRN